MVNGDLSERLRILSNTEQIDALKRVSPIAWTHINLYGKYDFEQNVESIDISTFSELIKNEKLISE